MPRPLYPQDRPGTHYIGGWVGPRTSLTGAEYLAPTEIRPRTVQSVEGRYTDRAIYITGDNWAQM